MSRPPILTLTSCQKAVLRVVREYLSDHGYPPSPQEICDRLGFRSLNAAACQLDALERKGHLTRTRNQARSVRLLEQHDRPDCEGCQEHARTTVKLAALVDDMLRVCDLFSRDGVMAESLAIWRSRKNEILGSP